MRAFLLCLMVVAPALTHARGREGARMKYILARADGAWTMSASVDDIPFAKSLQEKYGKSVLVFQDGGHLYLTQEERFIAQVEQVTRRSEPIERQREELRKRQQRVEKLEEALDDRIDRAEKAIDRATDSGDRERARQLRPQLDAAKEELRQLRPQQRELEEEERALDAKQDQIGDEVDAAVQQVAREALANGAAIKVR